KVPGPCPCPGFLPRGALGERGSTGGAGEGARSGGPQVHPVWTDAPQSLHMSRISPPWSGSEAGEYRRSRGGGAARRAAGSPRLYRSHPVLDHPVQRLQWHEPRTKDGVVEPLDVEAVAQRLLGLPADPHDLETPDHVRRRLTREGDVPVDLVLDADL